MVTVRLEIEMTLSEYIAQKARAGGLLTSEKIAALITTEVERQRHEAVAYLLDAMKTVSNDMRERFGDMSDIEAQAMIDGWIEEVEAEIREERRDQAIARTRDILTRLHSLEPQLSEEEIAAELRK
jgi:hypothetical protein